MPRGRGERPAQTSIAGCEIDLESRLPPTSQAATHGHQSFTHEGGKDPNLCPHPQRSLRAWVEVVPARGRKWQLWITRQSRRGKHEIEGAGSPSQPFAEGEQEVGTDGGKEIAGWTERPYPPFGYVGGDHVVSGEGQDGRESACWPRHNIDHPICRGMPALLQGFHEGRQRVVDHASPNPLRRLEYIEPASLVVCSRV